MTKTTALLGAFLLAVIGGLTGCASAPETERPYVDRPGSVRPEGMEPEGLSEMRSVLAEQRSTTREQENALLISPNTLTTTPGEPTWFDSALWTLADAMSFLRNF